MLPPFINIFSSWPALIAVLLMATIFFIWQKKSSTKINLPNFSKTTPTLAQYSRDLTQLAAEGKLDPVVGREEEIERIIQDQFDKIK